MAIVPGSIQILTKTIAWFALNDPILLKGQVGIEEDDLLTAPKYKIGNGVDLWSVLPYASSAAAAGLNAVLTISNTTLGKNIVVSSGDKILFNGGGGSVFEAFTDGTGIFNFYDQTTATTAYTIVSGVFQFGTGYQVSMDDISVLGISILGGDVNVGLAGVTDGTLVFKNATNANELTIKSGVTAANFSLTLPTTDSTGTQALVSNGSGVLSWATIGTGTVTSVSGTANRITSTGGATPVINIDAAYDALWQPIDADLTAIAALGFTSTSFLKKTGAGTWALDTNVYLNELGTTIGATTNIQEFTTGIQSAVFNASYILGSFGTGLELIGSTKSKLHLNHSGADITELGDADVAGQGTRLIINDGHGDISFYSVGLFEYNGQPILTDSSTATLTNKSGLISQWTNDAGYLTSAPASTLIVGSTTITGGANGRIPYNSSGFYQESANLVWDNGNSQLSLLGAGTAALPTIGIGAIDTGIYLSGASQLGFTAGGTNRFNLDNVSFRSVTNGGGLITRAAGTVSAPAHSYAGNVNYGDWLNGTTIARSINGVQIECTNSTGLGIFNTAPTSALHINKNQNSVTQNDANGILLANATAATVGLQSISPAIVLQGNGWKTNATAGSQDVRFRIDVLPVQGASSPTSTLQFASSINGGAYTLPMTLTSAGILNISNAVIAVGSVQGSSIFGTSAAWFGASASLSYRTTNAGGSLTPSVGIATVGTTYTTAGAISTMFSGTSNQIIFAKGNGTNAVMAASIGLTNLVNTAGSEAGDLGFYTQAAGAVAALRLTIGATALTLSDAVNLAFNTTTGTKIGTATTQKLSFWNATPVVQPTTAIAASTFVANTSAIANDTATFDGYTIGQIVKALRTLGILA